MVHNLGCSLVSGNLGKKLVEHVSSLFVNAVALLILWNFNLLGHSAQSGTQLDLVGLHVQGLGPRLEDIPILFLWSLEIIFLVFWCSNSDWRLFVIAFGWSLESRRRFGIRCSLASDCRLRRFSQYNLVDRNLLGNTFVGEVKINHFIAFNKLHLDLIAINVCHLSCYSDRDITSKENVDPLPGKQIILSGVAGVVRPTKKVYGLNRFITKLAIIDCKYYFLSVCTDRFDNFRIQVLNKDLLIVQLCVVRRQYLYDITQLQVQCLCITVSHDTVTNGTDYISISLSERKIEQKGVKAEPSAFNNHDPDHS